MENFYKFLEHHWLKKDDFTINQLEIKDIVILDKKIKQSCKTEIIQRKESEWDFLKESKIEIPQSHIFDKNIFKPGHYSYKAIEPWSFEFENCLTCDGHWEITCNKCSGSWEINCPTCKWKTYVEKKYNENKRQELICSTCNGSGKISKTCPYCKWQGVITKAFPCRACNGRGRIMQNWQMLPCKACNSSWKMIQSSKCNSCVGWIITNNCPTCNASWKLYKTVTISHSDNIPCTTCKETWRVLCNVCLWARNITCPTCHWERKTWQYQFNRFELDVELYPQLLKITALNNDEKFLEVLKMIPKKTVFKITSKDKELLVNYPWLKITKENISNLSINLYRFTHKQTWLIYYVVENKNNWQFYYKKLPPKTNMDAKLDQFWDKIAVFLNKIIKKYNQLKDYLTNKKNY